jgi:hypothetical protein
MKHLQLGSVRRRAWHIPEISYNCWDEDTGQGSTVESAVGIEGGDTKKTQGMKHSTSEAKLFTDVWS